ncbi:MAG: hypothetical protein HY077_14970 [Elusimicrobia bacterium]|nr:hypothetical protein [Elusimicrobiota bacterium]
MLRASFRNALLFSLTLRPTAVWSGRLDPGNAMEKEHDQALQDNRARMRESSAGVVGRGRRDLPGPYREPDSPGVDPANKPPTLENVDEVLPAMVQDYLNGVPAGPLNPIPMALPVSPTLQKLRSLDFNRVDHDSLRETKPGSRYFKVKVIFSSEDGEVATLATVKAVNRPWRVTNIEIPGFEDAAAKAEEQAREAADPVARARIAVEKFIAARKKRAGNFVMQDPVLGTKWILTLRTIHTDTMAAPDPGHARVCADFYESAKAYQFDIDFFVDLRGDEAVVERTAIHKINGEARVKYKDSPPLKQTAPVSVVPEQP